MSEITDELWKRARHLVEVSGQTYTTKGGTTRHYYRDSVIRIHWSYSDLGGDRPLPSLQVSCAATSTTLIAVTGASVSRRVEDYEAEPFVEHLRRLMVLDDLVLGVTRD